MSLISPEFIRNTIKEQRVFKEPTAVVGCIVSKMCRRLLTERKFRQLRLD